MKIKNWNTGKVIFEANVDSIKELVELAVRNGVSLRGANLVNAYLRGAYLRGAYLRGAYLRFAYLECADLRGADLRGANLYGASLVNVNLVGADLRGAYLTGADLTGSDLRDANLRNCIGNGKEIKSVETEEYIIVFSKFDDNIRIGCKEYSFEEWKNFTDDVIEEMDENALEWWRENRERVFRKFGEFKGGRGEPKQEAKGKWRLPTRGELLDAFDNKVEGFLLNSYWSSSPDVSDAFGVDVVYFGNGKVYWSYKSSKIHVRLVRDTEDGLEWRETTNKLMTWYEAMEYAEEMNKKIEYRGRQALIALAEGEKLVGENFLNSYIYMNDKGKICSFEGAADEIVDQKYYRYELPQHTHKELEEIVGYEFEYKNKEC